MRLLWQCSIPWVAQASQPLLSFVLIAVPGFGEDKVIGVLKAEAIPGGRTDRYRASRTAHVEVTGIRTLKSGRVLVELRPGAKKQ